MNNMNLEYTLIACGTSSKEKARLNYDIDYFNGGITTHAHPTPPIKHKK